MALKAEKQEMARRRAMLTDTERELLESDEKQIGITKQFLVSGGKSMKNFPLILRYLRRITQSY
jgi:hypothetical protein